MEIFVYRETNDNNCFDEEYIRLYKDLKTAENFLRLRVRKYFSYIENALLPFEEIKNSYEFEHFDDTRVVYDTGDGYMFFDVESYYVVD